MKQKKFFIALGLIAATIITSCSNDKDFVNNNTDTPEFVDSLIDNSVNPGDDFYSYCNGTWLKSAASGAKYCINDDYGLLS